MDWFNDVDKFMNEALNSEGINYRTNQKLNAELDKSVRTLAQDPVNAQKDGAWFLKEAHSMVKMKMAEDV